MQGAYGTLPRKCERIGDSVMAKLSEVLAPEDYQDLDRLVRSGKIKPEWVRDVFIPRLVDELNAIDFYTKQWETQLDPTDAATREAIAIGESFGWKVPTREQVLAQLARRRRKAYQKALNPSLWDQTRRQLENAIVGAGTGETRENFRKYWEEEGPVGFALDTGKSLVESFVGAPGAIAETVTGGLGEQPLSRVAEMTPFAQVLGGGGGLLARSLAKSAGRAGARSVLQSTGKEVTRKAIKSVPATQRSLAIALTGEGAGRLKAAEKISSLADATRYPGRFGEAADIAGAEENLLTEMLMEVAGEGIVEGGRFAGRRAVEQLQPEGEGVDPIQQKQQQRAADNEAAAAATAQRTRAPKTQAALDALALQLIDITHKVATGKENPSVDDIYRITPEAFVNAFENHIYPEFAQTIAELEEMGVYDAGNVIRANILDLHKKIQAELNQQLDQSGKGETPEQAAAADMAGQPTQEETTNETTDTDTTSADSESAAIPTSQEGAATNEADEVDTSTETTDPDTTTTQTPQAGSDQGPETVERDWAGLDVDVGNEVLETLSQEPDADMEATVDATISALVENQTLSHEDSEALKTTVVEQITPAIEELKQRQAAERELAEVPEERVGRTQTGFESDGTTAHRVRPVLRELDDIVPSHQLDGEKREDYPEDLQPREGRGGAISMEQVRNTARNPNFVFLLEFFKQFRDGAPITSKRHPRRVVSGNGRTLALQLMRQDYPENWEGYQAALRTELEKVGIDPAEADNMEAPVLVYELMDDTDEVALAQDANTQATLDHTATEQAGQDAQYFDDDLMALWQPGEGSFEDTLKSTENQAFRTALFQRIPTHLVSAFMTADNRNFSDDGIKRIQNAMIRYVFGEDIGDRLANVLIEQGLEDVKNVEAMLRNAITSLAYAKANGQDISTDLASAIFRFIEINKNAERDAQQRKQPKDVMLYAGIEAFYQSGSLIEAPTLLEKQLLYLIYAKRNAPRQLANDFQVWSKAVVQRGQAAAASLFDAAISEAIFAGMIREYIQETIFQTRQTQDGQTVLLPPESMPPELVNLREDIDAISTTEGKTQAVNDWIDSFLQVMNEGQQQTEVEPNAETETEPVETSPTPDASRVGPEGAGTSGRSEGGEQTAADPGDSPETDETPESPSTDGDPDVQGETSGDAVRTPPGVETDIPDDDTGSDLSTQEALDIAFSGQVTLQRWNESADADKRESLSKARQSTELLQRAGTLTAEEAERRIAAIDQLEQDLGGTTDADTTRTDNPEAGGNVGVETDSPTSPGEEADVDDTTGTVPESTQRGTEQTSEKLPPEGYKDANQYELTPERKAIEDLKKQVRQKMADGASLDEALSTSMVMGRDIELIQRSVRRELEEERRFNKRPNSVWAKDPNEWTAQDIWGILQNNNPERITGASNTKTGLSVYQISTAFRAEVQDLEKETGDTGTRVRIRASSENTRQIDLLLTSSKKPNIKLLRSLLANLDQDTVAGAMTTQEATDETQPTRRPDDDRSGVPNAPTDDQVVRTEPRTPPESTESRGKTPSEETQTQIDTNQVVGVSRRIETTQTPSDLTPIVKSALARLGISETQWQQAVSDGTAFDMLNTIAQNDTTYENVDAITDLHQSLDDREEHTPEDDRDEDYDEEDYENVYDVVTGDTLRDITDEQRSDFDNIRRKVFIAKTIQRLEAKGRNRTLEETLQLRALQAPRRTDAQQQIYERALGKFIEREVARLSAKPSLSPGEQRALDAFEAVQAEGLPEEASDRSLYTDLETPDQAHGRPLSESKTLAGVQAPDTADTELNLPETTLTDPKKLSPAQQTTVKAIIAAFKRKIHTDTDTAVQGGYLLADKMGVGKTRQALATILHYIRSGINRHFIIAPSQDILSNFKKDMGNINGNPDDISVYSASNPKPNTPVGAMTYSSLVSAVPNFENLSTHNALASLIEHLIGIRPSFQQTHPDVYRDASAAYARIFPDPSVAINSVEDAVAELRRQAERVNLKNRQHIQQFRARVPTQIADALLAERGYGETAAQGELFAGTEGLHRAVSNLLAFRDILNAPNPDLRAAAEAFEGVITLDEVHKAGNRQSQTGAAIAMLHQLLPNAKFLYMSATPFKKVENMAVAERLGLWGANQPFNHFRHFVNTFRHAHHAVKEVIALHIKQMGRYVSRALSSKETRYTPVEVPLTDTDKLRYDTGVELVNVIRSKFFAAIETALRSNWAMTELTPQGAKIEGQYKSHYSKMFHAQMQTFFLALLDAMKAEGLRENILDKLNNGDKVIVQLENTWDAVIQTAREAGHTGTIGPFELLESFVSNDNQFPVHKYTTEQVPDGTGGTKTQITKQMEYNAEGELVPAIDPNLKRLQQHALQALELARRKTPVSGGIQFAADIVHGIAADARKTSAEISGRTEIYPGATREAVKMPQGFNHRESRADAFSQTTDLNLLVLGPAGLTGINLPILEEIKDEVGGLFHYLIQSSWNVNTFEQGLGRGKRTNSAIDPHYIIAHQDLPGSERVLGATLAKFAEMGALAGQADNALMQNIDKAESNLDPDDDPDADVAEALETEDGEQPQERAHIFGKHGSEALYDLWLEMYNSGDTQLASTLGLPQPVMNAAVGLLESNSVPSVKQFFHRLLYLKTADQPAIYVRFEGHLKRIIQLHKELGTLDTGASSLGANDGKIADRLTVFTDPDTGQSAEVVRLDVNRKLPRRSWTFAEKVLNGEPGYDHFGEPVGLFVDPDGHIWMVFPHPAGDDVYYRWGPRGTPVQGIHKGESRIDADQLSLYREVNELEAKQLWEAEDASADTHVASEMFMATGLVLPKWNDLQIRGADRQILPPVMGVIPMIDGSQLHGLVIPASQVSTVLQQIGGVDPNHFGNTQANTETQITDPNVNIPQIVRDIIGQQTDTKIAARLNNIVEHIHKKLPLRLRGHFVRSAAEAALLGQLIRDPQVEHTWVVYRKNDRIVKIEPISLNRKGETKAGDFAHIKSEAGRLQADAILRIHNHPSGVAKWSGADKRAAMKWHTELGTLMAEDIIVDSGTYAYRTFENGKYTWHQEIQLDPQAVEWATGDRTIPDKSGELKTADVLYQNPLIRGAREAATYMMGIKRRTADVAELIFVDTKTGKITNAWTDTTLRTTADPVKYLKDAFTVRQGQQVHIALWGDDAAVSLAESLQGVEGVDSVWVNSQRITGMEHTRQQTQDTITKDIGGQKRRFVRVDDSELSDPSAPESSPIEKSFIVAGVQRDLTEDVNREDPFKRTIGDGEHIVSAKRTLDVNRLDATTLRLARQAIEKAVEQFINIDTDEKIDSLTADIESYETDINTLRQITFGTGEFDVQAGTVAEKIQWAKTTKLYNLPEVKDAFKGLDPEAKTWDTDIGQKLLRVLDQWRNQQREYESEHVALIQADTTKTALQPVIAEIKNLQAALSQSIRYNEAISDLSLKMSMSENMGEALDHIAATPELQTDEIQALFKGVDPESKSWEHLNIRNKFFDLKSETWNTRNDIQTKMRRLRDTLPSWDARAILDLIEEINSTHKISINRIEQGIKEIEEVLPGSEATIQPYLEVLWGHISTEEGVLNTVLKSGVIKALSPTGDPNINEGMLAYLSWSSYYRRSKGFHNNGVILDLELVLDEIPNITGTVHVRNNWGDRMELASSAEIREAMETWQDTDEDIVIEIRIPQDVDINKYLIGIIEDSKVYVEEGKHATESEQIDQSFLDEDRLRDYQPSAETPNINRAARAMPTKDQLTLQGKGRTRKWLSPQSQLFEKLRLWTPKLRGHKRVIANAIRSGYGLLEELKAPFDADKPGPGDIIEDMLDHRMQKSQEGSGFTRNHLGPPLKKLQQQVKREGGADEKALRAAVDHDIINFIEHNTPLRSAHRAFEGVATELKEAWRKVNQSYLEAWIGLMRDISHREMITKVGSQGREKWSPEPMGAGNDTMKWDWNRANGDGRFVGKDGKEYTIAEAFARADKLWYPHQYDRSRLRHYNRKMEDLVKALNELAAKGDAAPDDALATAGVEKVSGGYLHRRLKITFPDLDAVIKYYTDIRDRTATLIKMQEDGTLGMYPHLERVRETQDRLYKRETNLLMSTSALLWDRFAEIATFGQIDDLGHLPPRLATILQTVELYANDRETALMAVIDGLQATKESRIAAGDDDQGWGMHESIPAFEGGEAAALRIMQQWEDYYIDKDGKKVKTGKWKGIDINRLNLDPKTLEVLQQIGFIQSDGRGGWQVHGKTDAAQQTTIARFFVELMQTKANRKKRVQALVQSLGHWQQKDPLTEEGGELWRRMNTLVSIGALGWKQALQNLTEIPVVAMMAGMKSTVGMVKEMRDPDFRTAAETLTEGLKQGVEFLADDNLQEAYLNSRWSMFGYTERVSRMIGVGVGLTHAKNLTRELLASKEGSKNRARIEREMRRLRMNPAAILEMPANELDTIFKEVIQRIKSHELILTGLGVPSETPPKNPLTDRIGEEFVRAAMYLSDTVFKPYDARTLPDAFNSKDPRFRVFLKFKGWMLQQNRFMMDQYKRAYREARHHRNFRPLGNMLASTLMLTGSVAATQGVFALLQGRDNDDELLGAFLHTQTLGLGAVLWEMAVRSEGSPWRLEKTFEGTVVGPVWGTFADILSPTATGDLDRTLQEVMQRTPGARELLYLGANRWWENE